MVLTVDNCMVYIIAKIMENILDDSPSLTVIMGEKSFDMFEYE
jgi:hypothetical protein